MTAAPERFELSTLRDPQFWRDIGDQLSEGLREQILTIDAVLAFSAIAGALLVAGLIRPILLRLISVIIQRTPLARLGPDAYAHIRAVLTPLIVLACLIAAQSSLSALERDTSIVQIATNLAAAWLVIRLVTRFIRDAFWARTFATVAWIGAALNIFGVLAPMAQLLDAIGFEAGDTRLSLLMLLRAAVVVVILFALAAWLSAELRRRIMSIPRLEPSVRILAAKTVQVALIAAAIVLGLTTMGVDLSAFALFGGAIGLGIGFGLQQIFANLVSGVILLLDRSIKPGDVVEVDDTYGWVNSLGLRYVSVITRDGHEHLIPNEKLMIEKVVNWSFSNKAVRVKRSIGISYNSDVPKAMQLVAEAAGQVDRVLKVPGPKCLLRGFGDSSVDLEVRFWISDPENGVNAAASDVLLKIWETFHENGVEIPYPQRDLHLRSGEVLNVRMQEVGASESAAAENGAAAESDSA